MPAIIIDDCSYTVEEGLTLLEAAKKQGIAIPTLCHHPALKPSGACRLCGVEVTSPTGRSSIMLSCIVKVKEGMSVSTRSESVQQAREKAFKNLLQMAPLSVRIRKLAEEFNIHLGPPPDGCIRCRLCIRVCKEVVGPAALKMEKRNGVNFVTPVPGACIGCGTCANICPTDAIVLEDHGNVRSISIRDEVIGRHPLETCEGCGKRFATPKFLHHIEDVTEPHPHVKEHHQYCPTCAKLFSNRVQSFSRSAKR